MHSLFDRFEYLFTPVTCIYAVTDEQRELLTDLKKRQAEDDLASLKSQRGALNKRIDSVSAELNSLKPVATN